MWGPLEGQAPKTAQQILEQERQSGHISTESNKMWSETPISGLRSGTATLMAWALFPIAVFWTVLPMLPGTARVIHFYHTSCDCVSSASDLIHTFSPSLAKMCLSLSDYVPPMPHFVPKGGVSWALETSLSTSPASLWLRVSVTKNIESG